MTMLETDPEGERRLASLAAYDVLHHPPSRELQAVVDLAARLCQVPMATINLITDTEQHQVAAVGFDASVCSREDSMCAAILREDAPVVVPDARFDPRFADNPFVTGVIGRVRFYAAHKLVTHDGVTIGTLCVFDTEPRHIDAGQAEALGTLADRVVDILELSLRTRELASTLSRVEAMQSRLEESNARLASFAGQVSHDLKSPLTSVAASLQLIREQIDGGADQIKDTAWLLERAISGSTRMATLIDNVLEFAQMGSSMEFTDVDLAVVVAEVLEDLAGLLDGVRVEVGELPILRGDEVQLRSLLQNLLGNAAKFTHPDRAPLIHVSARRRGTTWRVEVTDNGRGVPSGETEQIFVPLHRADHSVEGTGIGLSTCRRIVEAHHGAIGLEPVPSGGTTFWFEIPA